MTLSRHSSATEENNMARFFVGLDLGQTSDYTALCVVEKLSPPVERFLISGQPKYPVSVSYHVRHLVRLPLNTTYPAQVAAVADLLRTPPLPGQSVLMVDQTGVGRPVVDIVRAAKMPCTVHAVTIHGGEDTTRDGLHWRVPKRDLISNAQIALQDGTLKIAARLPEAPILQQELLAYRVTIDEKTAHDSYNARQGQHDDLVLSLALALWAGEQIRPIYAW
jgi:hypothetical protein